MPLNVSSVRVVACVLDLVKTCTLKHRLQLNSLCTSCVKMNYSGKIHRHKSSCFLKKPLKTVLSPHSVAAYVSCKVEVQGCDLSANPFLVSV